MKAGSRLPAWLERSDTAIGSMLDGTIGGDSKIGMPVVEVRRVPLPAETATCFSSMPAVPTCPAQLTAAALPTNFGDQGMALYGSDLLYCDGSDVARYGLPDLALADSNEWSTTLGEQGSERFLDFTAHFVADDQGNIYVWEYLNPSTDSLLSLLKLTYTGNGGSMDGEVLFTFDDPGFDVGSVTMGWNPYDGFLYHVVGSGITTSPDGALRRTDTSTGATSLLYNSTHLVSSRLGVAFTPDGAAWLYNDESSAVGVYRYLSTLDKFVNNSVFSSVPIPLADSSVMMPHDTGGYIVFTSAGAQSTFSPPCSPTTATFGTISQLEGGCVALMQPTGESVWGFE